MLKARIEAYREILKFKSRDELIESALCYYVESSELKEELDTLKEVQNEMILQFQQMKDELSGAKAEVKALREINLHLTDIRELRDNTLFGRSTEKTSVVMNSSPDTDPAVDPLSEDATCEAEPVSADKTITSIPKKPFTPHTTGKKKHPGKRDSDLSNLPKQVIYDYDINDLNARYGEGNWRFAYWHKHRTVEVVRQYSYQKIVYTPAISYGLEHALISLPLEDTLLPKSLVSPSLFATLVTDKYNNYLPLNRQSSDPERFGIPFSRQTLSNWIVKLTLELLKVPYDMMTEQLCPCEYQQCDETTYLVIRNGKEPGSKGFMWVHRTSPLAEGNQIITYTYDPSRSAEPLRQFYEKLSSHIFLTSDAYSAYSSFEKENTSKITLCGCFMHLRRRFVEALRIVKKKGLNEEKLKELPEVKAISLIQKIYHEEGLLKELTPSERLALRKEKVKPCVNEFFAYIHSLDPSSPSYSDRLKDAILYSVHHEEVLCRFLSDGSIPIDNGATERSVKPIALGRHNYLFSNTASGAEATAILTSLIETAKANGADPYYYIKYLAEMLPKHVRRGVPIDAPVELMPWSEQYRRYQGSEKARRFEHLATPPGNEKPHTPRKRDIRLSKNDFPSDTAAVI
jgi:hypothetical protein